MCILITGVGGGQLFGASWMSSNYYRISSVRCRQIPWKCYGSGYIPLDLQSPIADTRQ